MQTIALDPVDRRLLHALQIEPRASWNALARVVGVDARTLARRWARLDAEGVAWITGHTMRGQTALIEIECDLPGIRGVIDELSHDPAVFVLDSSAGSRDLLALVRAADLSALATYSIDRLARLPGVRAIRTHVMNEMLLDASSWRLRELTPAQLALMPQPGAPRARSARQVADDVEEAILAALWADGRTPVAEIAERSGISPQRISDGIAIMRQDGTLRLRTDIARAASGWPVYAWYFVEAPSRVLEAAKGTITTVPEVRLAFTTASRYNLVLAVWLRRLSDVNRFEIALENAMTGARIADRAVVLRIEKHLSRIVGPETLAVGPA
ncbi:Lrp/AsnC family transcriptional regulator [Microbacterium sp. No. 7]|uniref:Lrp/AsnC family transcriptional regulator n=1 Tax=Microbacterium sp. No. 7 TaxID=1714373 RepID=UPI0006CFFD5C|nr:Lrp/AsnC family transcriptional regulator [Microbacterium sp. No. 7]ALJ18648.1 hypothetical protein AOA12_01445 [Microbacterium sp. No. 7]